MTFTAAPTDFLVNAIPTLIRRRSLVLSVCGILSIISLVGMVYTTSAPLVLLFAMLKGLSFAYFPVLMIMVFLIPGIKPREIGIGMAFMETSIWGGSAVGPLLVGGLQQITGNLQLSLLICGMFPVTLLVAAFMLSVRGPLPQSAVGLSPEGPVLQAPRFASGPQPRKAVRGLPLDVGLGNGGHRVTPVFAAVCFRLSRAGPRAVSWTRSQSSLRRPSVDYPAFGWAAERP